jgi:acetyl-CoA carboxylase biotin carboxyl carrier protein
MNKNSGEDGPVDLELVRRLADLLTETGLTEIEVEKAGVRIKVARGLAPAGGFQAYVAPPAAQAPAPGAASPAAAGEAIRGEVVKSPMVGTCYLQANPGAEPFIRPGSQVAEGQTLMIVEAMKTMNPIPAPRAGRVLEILVDDGQPVEFGEPLVVLE